MIEALSERALLERCFVPFAAKEAFGFRDDACLLKPPSDQGLVVTTDTLVAGVHFFSDDPLEAIAAKALRVNLSDLAAKGAKPYGFWLNLTAPETWLFEDYDRFSQALRRESVLYGCPLFGGDTVRTRGALTVSITAMGTLPPQQYRPRFSAQADDILLVSGFIGDAALALWSHEASRSVDPFHEMRRLYPEPRLGLGRFFHLVHAAMDVSDGFVGDAWTMASSAGLGLCLNVCDVPLSPASRALVQSDDHLREVALTGGDDYEVLLAAPACHFEEICSHAASHGVELSPCGRFLTPEQGLILNDAQGHSLSYQRLRFDHFMKAGDV